MKQALIFLAEGFEEVEAVTPLDFLRRAGVDAKFVSVCGTLAVTGAHGVVYQADMLFDQHVAAQADMLILPGGMPGAQHLQDHAALGKLLKAFHQEGKICLCHLCRPEGIGASWHLARQTGNHLSRYGGSAHWRCSYRIARM